MALTSSKKTTTKKASSSAKVEALEKRVAELEKLVESGVCCSNGTCCDPAASGVSDPRVDSLIRILTSAAMRKGDGPSIAAWISRDLKR